MTAPLDRARSSWRDLLSPPAVDALDHTAAECLLRARVRLALTALQVARVGAWLVVVLGAIVLVAAARYLLAAPAGESALVSAAGTCAGLVARLLRRRGCRAAAPAEDDLSC